MCYANEHLVKNDTNMISKITLNKVASYKKPALLVTDKKANLIYGLNGSGKSTFSNFMADKDNQQYSDCIIEGLGNDDEIHVYNQRFIYDNFFEPENLKGIFTLSKANKDAESKMLSAQKQISEKSIEKEKKEKELQDAKDDITAKQLVAKGKVWEIKTRYTGGDRVLEFCLEGLKSDGIKLLNYIESFPKPASKPQITTDEIKEDAQSLSGEHAVILDKLPLINFPSEIEEEELLKKQIVGNKNSSVASFIDFLGSSDWVKDGLGFIRFESSSSEICPFCQQKTISDELIDNIKLYFDSVYEGDVRSIREFLETYTSSINNIPKKTDYESNPKLESFKKDFEIKYFELSKILNDNKKLLEDKVKSPSITIELNSSKDKVIEINELIEKSNKLIEIHNERMTNQSKAFTKMSQSFWELMRWDYDSAISTFLSEKSSSQKSTDVLNATITKLDSEIIEQQNIVIEQQKHTINIDEAISNINNGLLTLGIDDFSIKKHSDILYKLVRHEDDSRIFQTLSEGEKMIISFLYFIEQCRGKKSAAEGSKKKIIVIDDPISSLSHIYVFNIGRLIHSEFLRNVKYEQVFLLTHSLYFFYEMTDTNKERRKNEQKLFRLRKNTAGTEILEMSYEEIQNDYHSYWLVIKDNQQPPALIANCMRNIIEYFYNFVEKQDLNNVFQKPTLQANKFDAFNRFINRESHSLGQNIFDYKEFNYDDFKDAFELVFKETGYENHYKKMIAK